MNLSEQPGGEERLIGKIFPFHRLLTEPLPLSFLVPARCRRGEAEENYTQTLIRKKREREFEGLIHV